MFRWFTQMVKLGCIALVFFQIVLSNGMVLAADNTVPVNSDAYRSVKEKITELIKKELSNSKTVGLSIALVDDQQTVWEQGFGYQNKEKNVLATADTLYQVGSITKLFTVSAAMQLAEQGKLNIDQPLQQFLPEFSIKSRFVNSQPITARAIMTHHSGIPSDYLKDWTSKISYTSLVGNLQNEYVTNPPNYIWSYSNAAMTILGHTVAAVSGVEYADYIHDELLHPIGMRRSFIANFPPTDNPLMSKTYSNGKEYKSYPIRDIPAGGLCSNVDDMARFMKMTFAGGIVNGQHVLNPATIDEMLRVQNEDIPLDFDLHMGLGWLIMDRKISDYAGKVALHTGYVNQFHSELAILPEYKLGVVILANSEDASMITTKIAKKTLELALREKSKGNYPKNNLNVTPSKTKIDSPKLNKYTGYYSVMGMLGQLVNHNGNFVAKIGDNSLQLVPNDSGSYSLKASVLGFISITPEQLKGIKVFFETVNGRDVMLFQKDGSKMMFAEKITPVPLPDSWKALSGTYEIVNKENLPEFMSDKIIVKLEKGFLLAELKVMGERAQRIILPVSDTEGIIAGLGRGTGDTVTLKTVNGQHVATISGLEYKQIK